MAAQPSRACAVDYDVIGLHIPDSRKFGLSRPAHDKPPTQAEGHRRQLQCGLWRDAAVLEQRARSGSCSHCEWSCGGLACWQSQSAGPVSRLLYLLQTISAIRTCREKAETNQKGVRVFLQGKQDSEVAFDTCKSGCWDTQKLLLKCAAAAAADMQQGDKMANIEKQNPRVGKPACHSFNSHATVLRSNAPSSRCC